MVLSPDTAAVLERMRVPSIPRFAPLNSMYQLCCEKTLITVFTQQVRALNLVYALCKAGELGPGKSVGVVGSGFAGLTVALAAAIKGCEVLLLEHRDDLLPLQAQNRNRWLHPHLYRWPHPEADEKFSEAGLEDFANWSAAPAAAVVNRIRSQFTSRAGKYQLHYPTPPVSGVSIQSGPDGKYQICWDVGRAQSRLVDVLILALGFGLEQRWAEVPFVSYWHNDFLDNLDNLDDQPSIRKALISGVGDGGLIDFLRLRMRRFDHMQTFQDLLSLAKDPGLRRELLDIEQNSHGNPLKLADGYGKIKGSAIAFTWSHVRLTV